MEEAEEKRLEKIKKIGCDLIRRYPELKECEKQIWKAYEAWLQCFHQKGKLMICGNGGSGADSQHIVGELMKGFCLERPLEYRLAEKMESMFPQDRLSEKLQSPLTAMALGSSQVFTSAYSNDVCPEMVYAQEVLGYARDNDILVAISTSGNSANVLNAVKVAKSMGIMTMGICGRERDNKSNGLTQLCDICIQLPETETYLVQELTIPVYHALCRMAEAYYWG